jgi:transketolase|tara:strand:- start:1325 stop:2149 length:825 start_codon:yes stop_codon:yes gene_type:complete
MVKYLKKNFKLDKRSVYLRNLIIDGLEGGMRGHIGSSLSLVEILRVLYDDILYFNPKKTKLENRDRFILSKGHGCLALYAMLVDKGFLSKKHLKAFCKTDSMLGGHPDYKIPGVETTTGSLGMGLSIGVGMAMALKIKKNKANVYVVIGDGESNEGSIWEALMSAYKNKLGNLTVILDHNNLQTYGSPYEVAGLDRLKQKMISFGLITKEINGHDIKSLKLALTKKNSSKPRMLICHTIKGKGINFAENNVNWHHKANLDIHTIKLLRESLNNK